MWKAFQTAWAEPIDSSAITFTEHPGQAREIAANIGTGGILVVAGGDGTVGEVISGIMDRPEPRPRLGIIPCGTGNDIARCAHIQSLEASIKALQGGESQAVDLIRIERGDGKQTNVRHAFLFANAGFSSIPMMKPWMKRFLGATGAYYLATLLQVILFRPRFMEIRIDEVDYSGPTFLLIASNAEYAAGGSMRIAPGARIDDGELNISIIQPLPLLKLAAKLFASMADGSYINEPEVSYLTGQRIEIRCTPSVVLDLDGELFGTTPATFSVAPLALDLIHAPAPKLDAAE